MTHSIIETVFPQFYEIAKEQPYDRDANPIIETVLQDLQQDTDKADALIHDINVAARDLLVAVLPPETATEDAAYIVEDRKGLRLNVTDILYAPDLETDELSIGLRVQNTALEQNFQALLDHLTAQRIAEELDTPTYIERLRSAFKRSRDGARTQLASVNSLMEQAVRAQSRISLLMHLCDRIPSQSAEPSEGEGKRTDQIAQLIRSAEFLEQYTTFLQRTRDSLCSIEQDVMGPANMAGAEGASALVSREVVRHAVFRPLPLLWALCVTLLVKIVLAQNTSEMLHSLAIPLLVLSFALTWVLSIGIGTGARSRRMKELRRHIRDQLRAALVSVSVDKDVIEFPTLTANAQPALLPKVIPFFFRGHTPRHQRRIAGLNLMALLIPAVLACLVAVSRTPHPQSFVARFTDAGPCQIAHGRLVFVTSNRYFVAAAQTGAAPLTRAVGFIFPELLAEAVDRSNVIQIRSLQTNVSQTELPDCGRPTPMAEGTVRTDALTVDFGDTSLNVLAAAIQAGGQPGVPPPDPVPSNAYLAISSELSLITETLDRHLTQLSIQGHDLHMSLSAALDGISLDSVIATPVIVSQSTATIQPETKSVSTHLFQTTIELPEAAGEIATLGNTLVLPFFTTPVRNQSLDSPNEAFEWGADAGNLNDPVVTADGKTYFARIAETLQGCLAGNATVEIDVIGLASRSWDGPRGTSTALTLNYHLAEGRRVGALRKLRDFMSTDEVARIFVQQADGDVTAMSELVAPSISTATLPRLGRFDSETGFDAQRDTLLAVSALDADVESPLEELFGRSVVLRMVRADGGPCQF